MATTQQIKAVASGIESVKYITDWTLRVTLNNGASVVVNGHPDMTKEQAAETLIAEGRIQFEEEVAND